MRLYRYLTVLVLVGLFLLVALDDDLSAFVARGEDIEVVDIAVAHVNGRSARRDW